MHKRRSTAMFLLAAWCAGVLAGVPAASAQFDGLEDFGQTQYNDSRDRVDVSVVAAKTKVMPGGDIPVAVVLDHDAGWHVHTNQPPTFDNFVPIPTQVRIDVPADGPISVYPNLIQWPQVHTIAADFTGSSEPYPVFEGKAVIYVPLTVAADAKPGTYTVNVFVQFQACDDKACLTPTPLFTNDMLGRSPEPYPITIEVVADPSAVAGSTEAPTDAELFADFPIDVWAKIKAGDTGPTLIAFNLFDLNFTIDASGGGGFVLLLLVAALGGFLLNLTPCVLPVIPLKIMGLSQSASNRAKCLALGIAMAIGVVAFWLVLGGVIASFAEFTSTNQLFQYPAFTITVGVIIAIMAVGMCGLFAIRLPQWVYMINPKHDSLGGSFGFGVMTAILSTPCTAPFMGAAAAWAATQHWTTTLGTFAAIGGGMALPYLVLSAFPALVDRMPRTGPASELIKQVMGLLMLAAAAFFIGSGLSGLLKEPTDPANKMYWWVVMGLVVAAGGWLIYRTVRITPSAMRRALFGAVGVILIAAGTTSALALTAKGPIDWEYYNPQRFEQRVAEGKIIIMDFTAEWCANCKTLEHSVLYTDRIVELTQQPDIVPMQVDLTGNNPVGNAKLLETGRRTIPLLAIFGPDGELRWMSDFYTVQNIVDAVEEVRGTENPRATAVSAVR